MRVCSLPMKRFTTTWCTASQWLSLSMAIKPRQPLPSLIGTISTTMIFVIPRKWWSAAPMVSTIANLTSCVLWTACRGWWLKPNVLMPKRTKAQRWKKAFHKTFATNKWMKFNVCLLTANCCCRLMALKGVMALVVRRRSFGRLGVRKISVMKPCMRWKTKRCNRANCKKCLPTVLPMCGSGIKTYWQVANWRSQDKTVCLSACSHLRVCWK